MGRMNTGTDNKSRGGRPRNLIKDQGTSKGKTQKLADHARHVMPRDEIDPGVSRRGARRSTPRSRLLADTSHPSQHGGVKADTGKSQMRGGVRGRKLSGAKRVSARDSDDQRTPGTRSRRGNSSAGARTRGRARQRTRTRN
jgi:hypothetical protein